MEVGLNYAFGSHPLHDVGYLRTLVQTAETVGFSSLWMPEHVVGFPADKYQSRYPYSSDGSVPWRGDLSLHDPLFVTVAAAQMTSTLRFGSGVVILPQRPPLLTAKELMSLDHLTGGRFEFGVGGGWSAEEYAALGVSFAQRGRRFDEYIEAIRAAWGEQPASYHGEFVDFDDVVLMPRPLTAGGPPILVGGSSPAAFRRAARLGDGWFGHWTDAMDVAQEMAKLTGELAAAGRTDDGSFLTKASIVHTGTPESLMDRLREIERLGVQEAVLIVPVRTGSCEADLELWAEAAGIRSR